MISKSILQPPADLNKQVAGALAEDVGSGDVTAGLLPAGKIIKARLVCKEQAVLCGQPWVNETFNRLDSSVRVNWLVDEGQEIAADTQCAQIEGPAAGILTGERTAVNFLQLLSGVATKTRRYVRLLEGTDTQLLDTRKTLPGLRTAQKYAVHLGGGANHRMGLFDCFLIKENHIAAMGGIAECIRAARAQAPKLKLEVEVESLAELRTAVAAAPDIIMLDNFSQAKMRAAVKEVGGRIPLEVSGGVSANHLADIAKTGVDYISVGGLTKDVRAIDFSLIADAMT